MARIFVCYRREDSSGFTRAIHDNLSGAFPNDEIFMDVDTIKPGQEFARSINDAVRKSDVFIAVIGKRWLAADEEGGRRIDNPDDYVRLEISTALNLGITVIPLLLEGTDMPKTTDLPDDIAGLAGRNFLGVSHISFRADMELLQSTVGEQIGRQPISNTVDMGSPSREKSVLNIWWVAGALVASAVLILVIIAVQPESSASTSEPRFARFLVFILIMSIAVSVMVAITAIIWRIRGRNLIYGLRRVVEIVMPEDARYSSYIAARILNESSNSLKPRRHPDRLIWRIIGPNVSWIDASDLPELLHKAHILDDEHDVERFEKEFFRIAAPLSDRFVWIMRSITFGWAMMIAFAFQADTFFLLEERVIDRAADTVAIEGFDNSASIAEPDDSVTPCQPQSFKLWPCGSDYYFYKADLDFNHVIGTLVSAVLIFLSALAFRVLYELVVQIQRMRRIH